MRRQKASATLAERQSFVAAALHLTHEKDPETDQKKERGPGDECRQPGALARFFARDLDLLLAEHVDQFRVLHRYHGLKRFICTVEMSCYVGISDGDIFDVPAVDFLKEAAERKDLRPARRRVLHYVI